MDENEMNVTPEASEVVTPEVEAAPYTESSTYTDTSTYSEKPVSNGNIGFSIASLVCGILSILCCCLWYLGVILAVVAIVFGIISLKKNADGRGMAIAGLITGGIGAVIAVVMIIFVIIGAASGETTTIYNEIMDSIDL